MKEIPIRCFFCIPIPEPYRSEISGWIDKAKRQRLIPGARWVARENLHITLLFCGELPPCEVKAIASEVTEKTLSDFSKPELSIEGLGTFGKPPKVLFARIGGQTKKLSLLYSTVSEICFRHGVERPRARFSPHLTLARTKEDFDLHSLSCPCQSSHWSAEKITFMKSQLTPGGPIYTPISEIPLK